MSENREPQVVVRTFTSLWQIETMIYKVWDWNLPRPVPARRLLISLAAFAPWMLLLGLLRVPFTLTGWHIVWWLPPLLIGWVASRPVTESKTISQIARSRVLYHARGRTWHRLRPARAGVSGWMWAHTWKAGS